MHDAHQPHQDFPIDRQYDAALQSQLDRTLRGLVDNTMRVAPVTRGLADAVSRLLVGGKRLRSRLALWAWTGYRPHDDNPRLGAIATLGASLECFQAAALLHDDLIDRSATRRGLPTAHIEFESLHEAEARVGSAQQFGMAGALLAGDLALIAAQQLVSSLFDETESGTAASLHRVAALWHEMATEVTAGQFLDLTAQSLPNWGVNPAADQELAFSIITAKSARYSVELPLVMGAALAGADTVEQERIAAFGRPLGEAFQLRDDLLGVFGDPVVTGKPSGDDIREGKRTLLMAMTAQRADCADRDRLIAILGGLDVSDADVRWVCSLVRDLDAHTSVEELIADRYDAAMSALSQCRLTDQARTRLVELAEALVKRDT